MLNIENLVRFSLSRVKVVHSLPGRLRLKIPNLNKVPLDYRKYDEAISNAVKILNGIEDMQINYVLGTVLINYDVKVTYEKKVIAWVKKVTQVCINNSNLFKKYSEINFQYIVNTIEAQLRDVVKDF